MSVQTLPVFITTRSFFRDLAIAGFYELFASHEPEVIVAALLQTLTDDPLQRERFLEEFLAMVPDAEPDLGLEQKLRLMGVQRVRMKVLLDRFFLRQEVDPEWRAIYGGISPSERFALYDRLTSGFEDAQIHSLEVEKTAAVLQVQWILYSKNRKFLEKLVDELFPKLQKNAKYLRSHRGVQFGEHWLMIPAYSLIARVVAFQESDAWEKAIAYLLKQERSLLWNQSVQRNALGASIFEISSYVSGFINYSKEFQQELAKQLIVPDAFDSESSQQTIMNLELL